MSHKSMWLGGLVTALACLIVAPTAFGYTKPDVNVIKEGAVANIQQQQASQNADLTQGGSATSGDAVSAGGVAVGGAGGSGGDAINKIDNSSNASSNTAGCQKAGCSTDSSGGSSTASTSRQHRRASSGDLGNSSRGWHLGVDRQVGLL